VRFKAHQAEDP